MSERSQLVRRFIANMFRFVILPLAFIALVWLVVWYFWLRDESRVAQPAKPDTAPIAQDQKQPKSTETAKKPNATSDDSATKPPARTTEPGKPTEPAKPAKPSEPKKGPTQQPSQSPSAPVAQAPAAGKNLADTGPGEVAALFVAVSALSAAAYHYRLQRQTRA